MSSTHLFYFIYLFIYFLFIFFIYLFIFLCVSSLSDKMFNYTPGTTQQLLISKSAIILNHIILTFLLLEIDGNYTSCYSLPGEAVQDPEQAVQYGADCVCPGSCQ